MKGGLSASTIISASVPAIRYMSGARPTHMASPGIPLLYPVEDPDFSGQPFSQINTIKQGFL